MSKAKFVFICAAGHSGSTLLDRLLGSHPDGVSVGEVTQLPKNIALNSVCSCGEPLSDCRFWRPLITSYGAFMNLDLWRTPYALNLGIIRAGREIDPAHQTRARMMLRKLVYGYEYGRLRWHFPAANAFRTTVLQGAQNKRHFFHFLLQHEKKQFVIDSSKHYLEAINLHDVAPAETRIVWLHRDGRAVFNSGLNRGMSPKRALNAWARHCRRSSSVLEKNIPSASLITVRYESLASEPERQLHRVCDFLGIEFTPRMLDLAAAESHIANGNRMRFDRTAVIKLDEKWRQSLSPDMRRFFERHAGGLNRRLGYDT